MQKQGVDLAQSVLHENRSEHRRPEQHHLPSRRHPRRGKYCPCSLASTKADRNQGEPGSTENYYGNAFYAKKTKLATPSTAMSDYNGDSSRTWEMANTDKLNPYSKKPVSYKLVSREVPKLLPKEGSLVWKRAGFARHAVHVTKCRSMLDCKCRAGF